MKNYFNKKFLRVLLFSIILFTGCGTSENNILQIENQNILNEKLFSINDIPKYNGTTVIEINNNIPYFFNDELSTTSFEKYSELDELGRCGVAIASVGIDIMPIEERSSIGQVKPTGWQTVRYDDIIPTKYLYNRCHLLAFQLTGENANVENLITGTRQMNETMIAFENMITDYVKETSNHVYYRVTPIFESDNLVATGILMEAKSVEDNGEGVMFNVFCYNVQDGIEIDYSNADSWLSENNQIIDGNIQGDVKNDDVINFVLNINSNKIHIEDCFYIDKMNEDNRKEIQLMFEELENSDYDSCKVCIE